MRSETKYANAEGRFEVGPGFQVVVEPEGKGAVYPVELLRNGDESNPLGVYSDRAVTLATWTQLTVRGAEPGSAWRVMVADHAEDVIGVRTVDPKPVLLWEKEFDLPGPVANGSYDLPTLGTEPYLTLVDVREYRHVKLSCVSAGAYEFVAQRWKLYLLGFDSDGALMQAGEELGAGTANDFAEAEVYGYVAAGEGLADSTGTHTRRTGTRFNTVAAKVVLSGGPTELNGPLLFQLWGYP
jgi:hypothetical protein